METVNKMEYPRAIPICGKLETVFDFDGFLAVLEREIGWEAVDFIRGACGAEGYASYASGLEDELSDASDENEALKDRIDELESALRVEESRSANLESERDEWIEKYRQAQSRMDALADALCEDD